VDDPVGSRSVDDSFRPLIEGNLWTLTQELLALGQSVILEWGRWARVERDEKRLGARALAWGSSCTTSTCRWRN